MCPIRGKMKERLAAYILLIFLGSGFFGCTLYPTFVERVRDNEVVVDAWARGKRAEKRREYEKAKQEYYFVKRFATTYYLQIKAQKRYEAMSRILEEGGEEN